MRFSIYYGVYHNVAQIAQSRNIRREGEGDRKRKRNRGRATEKKGKGA